MRIFLFGRDNIGWSIDHDRRYTEAFLREIGHTITPNLLRADVVHSVWWDLLLSYRVYPLRWKKIIAVITHEINTDSAEFLKAKKFVNLWIAPSQATFEKLKHTGVDVKYQPFYVDENIFRKLNISKEEIARELSIDYALLANKLVISSYQRDSLGADLSKPKWQKDPGLLINILSKLPKDQFILLLTGPRRHWIINQCKRLHIPYYYYGEEPKGLKDDIRRNTFDKNTINKLYNLTDLYIVSSRSEGGPKAVLESVFTMTMILSTNVGLTPDFLKPWCIYETEDEAISKIEQIMKGKDTSAFLKSNYQKTLSVASYKPVLDKWKVIYEYFKDTYLL